MRIIFQKIIFRHDLHANRKVLYLFGDNEQRRGLGGQATEMRGEPNAVGIRTKRSPSSYPDAFWSDTDLDRVKPLIDEDFERPNKHAFNGGIVIVPMDGIGTGLADLTSRAPMILQYIRNKLADLMLLG